MFKHRSVSSRSRLDKLKQPCIFGCTSLNVRTHKFPNPIRHPSRFADWLDIICDSVEPSNPLIAELINSDPIQIYMNKCICDTHFDFRIVKSNNFFKTDLPMKKHKVLNRSDFELQSDHNYCTPKRPKSKNHEQEIKPIITIGDVKCPDAKDDINDMKMKDWSMDVIDLSMYDNNDKRCYENRETTNKNYNLKEEIERDDPALSMSNINAVHEHFKCNSCQGPIIGFRYTCVQCADFDLCALCESGGAHAAHYMLRVPGPRSHIEVKSLLMEIRRKLIAQNFNAGADFASEDLTFELNVVKPEPDDYFDSCPPSSEDNTELFAEDNTKLLADDNTNLLAQDDTKLLADDNTKLLAEDNTKISIPPTNTDTDVFLGKIEMVDTKLLLKKQMDAIGLILSSDPEIGKDNKTKDKLPWRIKKEKRPKTNINIIPIEGNAQTASETQSSSPISLNRSDTRLPLNPGTTVYIVKRPSMLKKKIANRILPRDPLTTCVNFKDTLREVRVLVPRLKQTEIDAAVNRIRRDT